MSRSKYEKREKELNDLPIEWERHESRDTWAVLELPSGVPVTYHMGRGTYRIKGQQDTTKAAPELLYKRFFTEQEPALAPFGRYVGHSVAWVVENDRWHARWMLSVAEADWLREALEEKLGREQE